MKNYIVRWLEKEQLFENARKAIIYAENVAEENLCSSYVYGETKDGVRDEEPFFSCESGF